MSFYITYHKDRNDPIKKVDPVWYGQSLDHFSVAIDSNRVMKLMINADGQWRELGKEPDEESRALGKLIEQAFEKNKS